MTTISATLVKELREMTGAGIMDAKRALQETGGDIDAAQRVLRERGMASAAKRAGRATTEGKVGYRIAPDGHRGSIVGVGCETEPVSNNDEFLAFAEKVLSAVDERGVGAEAELEDERTALSAKLGENITIVLPARFERVDGGVIAAYAHPPANKLGVLVQIKGGGEELARRLAMHIAWSDPDWIAREDVPDDVVGAEREILMSTEQVQEKPEQAREKIVGGMLNKHFFGKRVLAEQEWIHDDSLSVAKVLETERAEVVEFQRVALTG